MNCGFWVILKFYPNENSIFPTKFDTETITIFNKYFYFV